MRYCTECHEMEYKGVCADCGSAEHLEVITRGVVSEYLTYYCPHKYETCSCGGGVSGGPNGPIFAPCCDWNHDEPAPEEWFK